VAEQHAAVVVRSGARACRCSLRMNKIQVLGHQRLLLHQKRQQAFFPFQFQLDIYALDFKDTGQICRGTFFKRPSLNGRFEAGQNFSGHFFLGHTHVDFPSYHLFSQVRLPKIELSKMRLYETGLFKGT